MMKNKIYTILMLLVVGGMTVRANDYGVGFQAYDQSSLDRTSILLNEGRPLPLGDDFRLHFRLDAVRQPCFGKVFCIRTDDGHHIDGIFSYQREGGAGFLPSLLVDNRLHVLRSPVDSVRNVGVSLTIRRKKGEILFQFGRHQLAVRTLMGQARKATVTFGRHLDDDGNSDNSDVAPVELWDVGIDTDGQTAHFWELNRHNDSICYDRIAQSKAIVRHGRWLLDEHVAWETVFSQRLQGKVQTAFDARNTLLYIVDDRQVMVVNPLDQSARTIDVKGGLRAMPYSNHLVCDPLSGQLLSYNLEQATLSRFQADGGVWDGGQRPADEPDSYNHSVAWQGDTVLYAFGGYGHYRFKNSLYRLSLPTGRIDSLGILADIPPRAEAAAAVVGSKLYVFGGYGNQSGEQEKPAGPFYDLYETDLSSGKTRRLWTVQAPDGPDAFICAGEMYYNEVDSSFYVATSRHGGELIKVYINRSQWDVVTLPFLNDFVYKDLTFSFFKSDAAGLMLAVADKLTNDLEHDISVYSIRLPLQESNVIRQRDDAGGLPWWVAVIGLAVLAILGVGLGLWYRKRHRRATGASPSSDASLSSDTTPSADTVSSPDAMPSVSLSLDMLSEQMPPRPGITMLGKFQVTSRQGEDITAKLAPRLRDLLVLLLLTSVSDQGGITVQELSYKLWPDMDDEAARNNRNVYLRKLRLLLEEVGDITIHNDKRSIRVAWGDGVCVDYAQALTLLRGDAQALALLCSDADPDAYRHLLLRGPLLPELSYEWLDTYKSAYSDLALPALSALMKCRLADGDYTQAYRCASAILQHAPFDEQAAAVKCSILRKTGNIVAAKNFHERFCRDYEHAMGEPFGKGFNELSTFTSQILAGLGKKS